ncbi:MAG: hypothetical protein ACR2QH_11970 [Geminicoccaceae bacterium]
MQIDWITVIAQLVNFLVLIWLLKRFLYGPITQAIERCEARITERMQDAEDATQEAEKQAEALAEQHAALDYRQDEIMDEARHQAKMLRERLEQEAREEVETLRIAWRQQVDDEREDFLGSIRQSAARHVVDLARSVLKELADADLEAQVAKRFADRLRALDDKSRQDLATAAEAEQEHALIESPFVLSDSTKAQLTRTVREVIGEDLHVNYSEVSELMLGLRLRIGGRTVTWTLADYFDRLEASIGEALQHSGAAKQRHVA